MQRRENTKSSFLMKLTSDSEDRKYVASLLRYREPLHTAEVAVDLVAVAASAAVVAALVAQAPAGSAVVEEGAAQPLRGRWAEDQTLQG